MNLAYSPINYSILESGQISLLGTTPDEMAVPNLIGQEVEQGVHARGRDRYYTIVLFSKFESFSKALHLLFELVPLISALK